VAEDRRPPGADVIDVFAAVDIPDVGASRPLDEEGLTANAAEGSDRRVDAAGDSFSCRSEEL
jgi:hypothetical protein